MTARSLMSTACSFFVLCSVFFAVIYIMEEGRIASKVHLFQASLFGENSPVKYFTAGSLRQLIERGKCSPVAFGIEISFNPLKMMSGLLYKLCYTFRCEPVSIDEL